MKEQESTEPAKFNEEHEYIEIDELRIPFYRPFYGRHIPNLKQIKQSLRHIAPPDLILERFINSTKNGWRQGPMNCSASIVFPAEGDYSESRFKFLYAPERYDCMYNPESWISPHETCAKVSCLKSLGQKFIASDLILNRNMTQSEVIHHPLWFAVFRGNRDLLEKVADKAFYEARKEEDRSAKTMGIYVRNDNPKISHEQPLVVGGLPADWGYHFGINTDNRGIGSGFENCSVGVHPARYESWVFGEQKLGFFSNYIKDEHLHDAVCGHELND